MECQHISEQEDYGVPKPAVVSSSGKNCLVALRFLEESPSFLLGVMYNCSKCVFPKLLFFHFPQGIFTLGFDQLSSSVVLLKMSCTWNVYCSDVSFFSDKKTITFRHREGFQNKESEPVSIKK